MLSFAFFLTLRSFIELLLVSLFFLLFFAQNVSSFLNRSTRDNVDDQLDAAIEQMTHKAVLDELARLRGTTVEGISQTRLGMVPLRREAQPSECASLICFLLSEQASYLTGQAIVQDGGIVTG